MNIKSRLDRLEAAIPPPPMVIYTPFGSFSSPQEMHEHPACAEYIEQRRQDVLASLQMRQTRTKPSL